MVKIIQVSAAFLIAKCHYTLATFQQMITNIDLLQQNAEMVDQEMSSMSGSRNLRPQDMGLLNNYGCWCFFEVNHGQGKGLPVNELDRFCKILHDGYNCIMHDALVEENRECVPWELIYNSAWGGGIPTGMTMEGIVEECNLQNNPNSCEARTCMVEGFFVQSFFKYHLNGGQIDVSYQHVNGFDHQGQCLSEQSGIQSEKSCCGQYPIRWPYKTYGGDKDCCETRTYDTGLFSCCADGSVQVTCL